MAAELVSIPRVREAMDDLTLLALDEFNRRTGCVDPAVPREFMLRVRLSPAEHEALTQAAGLSGLSLSEYVRRETLHQSSSQFEMAQRFERLKVAIERLDPKAARRAYMLVSSLEGLQESSNAIMKALVELIGELADNR